MSLVSYSIFITSLILEAALLWRLFRAPSWRRYAGLTCYVAYELVAALVLFAVLRSNAGLYGRLYWKSEIISLMLGFFVFGDVLRYTFPQSSKLRGILWRGPARVGLVPTILAGSLWALACFWKFHSRNRALEHGLGFILASLILMVLLSAKYYQVPLGRNVWGMAFGLGAYASISTVIFGATDLTDLFVPYMQILRPLAFVAVLGLWTWALWIYAPAPSLEDCLTIPRAKAWDSWSEAWKHAISMVRRTMYP